jgi:hypothetical protein
VPPSRCVQQGSSRVTCTAPAPGVAEAIFRTYPSLGALYAGYETAMKSLDGGRVVQDSQDCGLSAPPAAGGEVGWNHQFDHPRGYTIAQMAAGKVGVTQAAGRVFCVTNASTGMAEFVWTQDDGRVLGWVTGPLHEQVWNWWLAVHHEIAIGKPPMMMPSMGSLSQAPLRRGDVRFRDGLAVGGVGERRPQPLAVEDPRQPLPRVVPHPVQRQRRAPEPLRADLARLRRLP